VHVNDVGAAIEAGLDAGRPSRITVTRFADQLGAAAPPKDDERDDHDWAEGSATRAGRAVVVVCSGERLAALFAAEGATVLAGTPSTGEVLAAIESTGAGRVVVLPNDRDVAAVAGAAADEARARGIKAGVVPTRSPVQGLAALAVRDPERRFEDDVLAMAEAAGACRYAEVTIAAREALTVAGRCQPGDVLALIEGEVNLIGHDLLHTSRQLLDRMLAGGGELVTLVTGEDAPPGLADELRAHLAERWPFAELSCYEGGQPHYPLLVGVE
jgi:dihydroxyacetone kinase-like predicted kinase